MILIKYRSTLLKCFKALPRLLKTVCGIKKRDCLISEWAYVNRPFENSTQLFHTKLLNERAISILQIPINRLQTREISIFHEILNSTTFNSHDCPLAHSIRYKSPQSFLLTVDTSEAN